MKNQESLTGREKQVMNLVIQGKLNKEIALTLGITQSTVEKHLSSIYAKLEVRNRIESVLHYKFDNSRNPQLPLSQHGITLLQRLGKGDAMSKRDLISSIIAGVILGVMALGIFYQNKALFITTVYAQTDVDSIRQLMLTSHENWSSIDGEAVTTWYLSNGQHSVVTSEFSIVNPDKARFHMPAEGITWISDGKNIFEINDNESTYVKLNQPNVEGLISNIPTGLDTATDEIFRYPLAMWALSPIGDYIYPTGLAQRIGDYKLLGEGTLLDRKVWIISYQLTNELGVLTMNAMYWVDQELGLIIKAKVYSTETGTPGKLIEETAFQRIEINPDLPDDTFAPALEGYREVDAE